MSAWRAAGLNYVRFSQVAASVARRCVKESAASAGKKPADPTLKITVWENGKAVRKLQ